MKAHDEILTLLGNINMSNELKQYIEKKLHSVNVLKLINGVSDNHISADRFQEDIKFAQEEKAFVDEVIQSEMASVSDVPYPVNEKRPSETPRKHFLYDNMENARINNSNR